MLLGRLTARDDVVFGMTVAGRPADLAGVEQMVGLFINTLPLRIRLRPGTPLTTLLADIQESQSQLLAYQHVGLAEIQRVAGAGELFDTLVVFENYPVDRAVLAELDTGVRVAGVKGYDAAHYPLSLMVMPGERLHLRLDFDPTRFEWGTAESVAARFVRLLEVAVAVPDAPLHRLEVLSTVERQTLLEMFNATAHAVPEATLPGLFEAQVERTPEAVAVVSGGETLSYAELNARANRLAHHLIGLGVGPEALVGVCLGRSAEMVVGILAILKAGGSYLPLDPDYPEARLAYMLADAAPGLVLSTAALRGRLPGAAEVLTVDVAETRALLAQAPAHNPADHDRICRLRPRHPAYVIYTSGSTGTPKGVMVTHAGIPTLAGAQVERLGLTPRARVLQFASLNFDASLSELVMTLTTGAASILLREEARSGPALREELVAQRVSHATLPPVILATLKEGDDLPLEGLIVAGDACPGELVARWSRSRRMVNAYGPTETTVCATMSAPLSGSQTPPIGSPIWNTRVYVLDGWLEPVPLGVAGELYSVRHGSAGYLGRRA